MTYRRKTAQEIKAAVQELSQEAKNKVEEYAQDSEGIRAYLDFMSKFYQYSPRNNALIKESFEGALAVKGFKQWKEEGFSVRKGEKAIEILIPSISKYYKDKEGKLVPVSEADSLTKERIQNKEIPVTKQVSGFTKGHVFDITQTNAEEKDYPAYYPNRREEYGFRGDSLLAFNRAVEVYTREHVESLTFQPIPSVAKGYYELGAHRIVLNSRLNESEKAKTLIHELAHAKMHGENSPYRDTTIREKEMQAEMTAYVVSKSFGLDPDDASIRYVANWTGKFTEIENIEKNLAAIQKTSREMIQGIDTQYGFELEKEAEKSTIEKESGIPVPEKADEISQHEELEEGKERPDKPYILIQNVQALVKDGQIPMEKGNFYTVEETEQIFEDMKEQPFKIRYQLFDSNATDPITDKKLTKTVSHSYRKGTFTQASYNQIAQLKDKGVQHTMQKVNERELE
ncbi:protein of unknown function [Trichococcus flocculiformis]|uniref:ArdC family protein n=1 Tax=Trichococcus TaxID=82802 RepID=UPI0007A8C793|nr:MULTISPECIES: ArdC-like ssDNA-binding domain-containing protein [Trichococcus]CZR09821.1 Hypothetical protein TES5_2761 [Trichococcus sp. ES5]SHG15316.1 protein of unknown function [Trichococcus flocculiformis]